MNPAFVGYISGFRDVEQQDFEYTSSSYFYSRSVCAALCLILRLYHSFARVVAAGYRHHRARTERAVPLPSGQSGKDEVSDSSQCFVGYVI